MTNNQDSNLKHMLHHLLVPCTIVLVCCCALTAQQTSDSYTDDQAPSTTQPRADASASDVMTDDKPDESEADANDMYEQTQVKEHVMEQQQSNPESQNKPAISGTPKQGDTRLKMKQSIFAEPSSAVRQPANDGSSAAQTKPDETTPATDKQDADDSSASDTVVQTPEKEAVLQPNGSVVTQVKKSPAVKAVVPNLVPAHKSWDYYKPLVERNIFTRSKPRSTNDREQTQQNDKSTTAALPPAPKASWVLTGIVIHAQGNFAFFENSLTNVTLRVCAGESLGDSRVTHIASDHVLVSAGQTNQSIAIGSTIDGSAVSLGEARSGSVFGNATPPVSTSETNSGASSSATSAGTDDSSKMSIIERMKARRLKEANK